MESESDSDIYIECSPVGTSDENVLTGIYKDKYIRLEDRIDRESNRVINKIKKILHKKSEEAFAVDGESFTGFREGNVDNIANDATEAVEATSESIFMSIKKYIKQLYKITVIKNIDWVRGLFIGLISIIMFNKLLNKLENKSDIKK
jgi:hypothetical protein